jgi:hypothetical protein
MITSYVDPLKMKANLSLDDEFHRLVCFCRMAAGASVRLSRIHPNSRWTDQPLVVQTKIFIYNISQIRPLGKLETPVKLVF